jgi:spore coat protein U-like protein
MGRVKLRCLRALSAGLLLGALMLPGAARADSATAGTDAVIVRPLSFTFVENLDFGSILAGPTAGTVTISPLNIRTKTGGPTLFGTSFRAAEFAGMGTPNQLVDVSLGANRITLTRVGGPQTMTVNAFVIGSTPTAQITTRPRRFRIASSTGLFQFPMGARLNVRANQRAGVYNGTFSVTLNYR